MTTHQVVSGAKFSHIMIVMVDKPTVGNLFFYDKIFGGVELSKTDSLLMMNLKKFSIQLRISSPVTQEESPLAHCKPRGCVAVFMVR